ncbi:MAG TPA: Nif3-like dinuclear metal center hexameric protein [Bacteroidia bacterium]|nr:Nif3-like dinuclear metal center hexameric protein [Bacteroidia bacterium]HNT80658.1 Nif3-like dinuclear metal center hexameric protein [Bacteroidia bacterium]
MASIGDVLTQLDSWAPYTYQESYDNSGLIVGDKAQEVKGILLSLDVTEKVIDEAIQHKCNLIVSHHPIVFSGLKRFTGSDYVERCVIKAIKNDIALLSIHTNLDNVVHGVNLALCKQLDFEAVRVLSPLKSNLYKLVYFCPIEHHERVRKEVFAAGAGSIGNYQECSFNLEGEGTFKPNKNAKPYTGEIGELKKENEIRVEVLVEKPLLSKVLQTLLKAHPYEEVAYDVYALENMHHSIGAGMLARIKQPLSEEAFLQHVKTKTGSRIIRHSPFTGNKVEWVALCGGSGSFLTQTALSAGAQAFITSDFKYHQFFDANNQLLITDIGHFESECFIMNAIHDFLKKNFTNLALRLTEFSTNPVNYF